jgi:hypothetical protein
LKKLDGRTHTADVDFINTNGILARNDRGVQWSFQDGVLEYTTTNGVYVVVQIRVVTGDTDLRGFYKNADVAKWNHLDVVFDCKGVSTRRVIGL